MVFFFLFTQYMRRYSQQVCCGDITQSYTFQSQPISHFWKSQSQEFPKLCQCIFFPYTHIFPSKCFFFIFFKLKHIYKVLLRIFISIRVKYLLKHEKCLVFNCLDVYSRCNKDLELSLLKGDSVSSYRDYSE